MNNVMLLGGLFGAEAVLLGLAAAIYFLRKRRRQRLPAEVLPDSAGVAQTVPLDTAGVTGMSYAEHLHQQIELTHNFLYYEADPARRTVGEQRLQYLEAELAAIMGDQQQPNWDVLMTMLDFGARQAVVLDEASGAPLLDDIVEPDVEMTWDLLCDRALSFVQTSAEMIGSIQLATQAPDHAVDVLGMTERVVLGEDEFAHALDWAMSLQSQDEFAQLRAFLAQYQVLRGNCVDTLQEGGDTDALNYYVQELIGTHTEIQRLAETLGLIAPGAVSELTSSAPAVTAADDDGMQFMELEEAPLELGDDSSGNEMLIETAPDEPSESGTLEVDLSALENYDIGAVSAAIDQEIIERSAEMRIGDAANLESSVPEEENAPPSPAQ